LTTDAKACIIIAYSKNNRNKIILIDRYVPSQKRQEEMAKVGANLRPKPRPYMVLFDLADNKFEVYSRGEWQVQYSTWIRELGWDEYADHSDEEVVEAMGGDEWFITQV
tara:strand:+ start:197 stop:523 length:327 start_codon:yes stop_codon:yes gene_type:complete